MLAVHVAFGGAAAGITLTLSPASWPLAATFAVIFVLMGAGLSLLYRKGSPGEKLVAVYDAHRRRLLVPAISLDVEREAIGGLEYRVSRVIDDDGGVNRVEPFFAELILRRRGGGESLYVVACTFGSGNLNSRAVNQFAASVGCSYGFVRIPADQRVTRSELRAVISEPF